MKTIQEKRINALAMLEAQLVSGVKPARNEQGQTISGTVLLTDTDKRRLVREIAILKDRLNGIKKPKKQSTSRERSQGARDEFFAIDIYSVKYSYAKKSDRRKAKGSSTKALKKAKSITFLKTVASHVGLMTNYRNGTMGISPKGHKFILRDTRVQASPSL